MTTAKTALDHLYETNNNSSTSNALGNVKILKASPIKEDDVTNSILPTMNSLSGLTKYLEKTGNY